MQTVATTKSPGKLSLYQRIPLDTGRSRQPLLDATRIICMNPSYAAELASDSYFERLWVEPWLAEHILIGDSWAFTWLRRTDQMTATPNHDEWSEMEGDLWVVDWVHDPRLSPGPLIRQGFNALLDRGIAREGERVYVYRYLPCRYGHFVARRRQSIWNVRRGATWQ